MIIFNNQEFNSFKELREKCHLVSERETCVLCHCKWKTIRTICEKYKIEKYPVISNGLECFVYDESIIELIRKIKPQKKTRNKIPDDYVTRNDLAKFLGVSKNTLSDIEFWCWDFKNYKKSFSGVVCYEFTETSKEFYTRKLHKWRHPDRKHGTCWQR